MFTKHGFFSSLLGKDNVCCYGSNGNLLDSRVHEGGTLQRYHYLGGDGVIPYVTNFYNDVLLLHDCDRYFGQVTDLGHSGITSYSDCSTYIKFRNLSSCYNYVPPQPGANSKPYAMYILYLYFFRPQNCKGLSFYCIF